MAYKREKEKKENKKLHDSVYPVLFFTLIIISILGVHLYLSYSDPSITGNSVRLPDPIQNIEDTLLEKNNRANLRDFPSAITGAVVGLKQNKKNEAVNYVNDIIIPVVDFEESNLISQIKKVLNEIDAKEGIHVENIIPTEEITVKNNNLITGNAFAAFENIPKIQITPFSERIRRFQEKMNDPFFRIILFGISIAGIIIGISILLREMHRSKTPQLLEKKIPSPSQMKAVFKEEERERKNIELENKIQQLASYIKKQNAARIPVNIIRRDLSKRYSSRLIEKSIEASGILNSQIKEKEKEAIEASVLKSLESGKTRKEIEVKLSEKYSPDIVQGTIIKIKDLEEKMEEHRLDIPHHDIEKAQAAAVQLKKEGFSEKHISHALHLTNWPKEIIKKILHKKSLKEEKVISAKIPKKKPLKIDSIELEIFILRRLLQGFGKLEIERGLLKKYPAKIINDALAKIHQLEDDIIAIGLSKPHDNFERAKKQIEALYKKSYYRSHIEYALLLANWPKNTVLKLLY